ncbi:MAG: hypothetical protein WBC05_23450 [Sedimentisphaerales bacterium]
MKKFIIVAVILMCCLVYAIVKLSMSENQNVNNTTEEKQNTKQINAGNTDKATPAEETQSAKQINADNTDKATPEEDSGSDRPVVQVDVPAAQVEAVTKALSEFQSALKSEDYEQAFKLMSEHIKTQGSFEDFKKGMAGEMGILLAKATIHPESAINIEGRVGLLITIPSEEQDVCVYMFFIQEDGQWKFYDGEPAQNVDTWKE